MHLIHPFQFRKFSLKLLQILPFSSVTIPESNTRSFPLKDCISLLQASANSFYKLKQIHGFSIRKGVPNSNPDLGKHLIFFAVSLSPSPPSSSMCYAHNIFAQIQKPNIFTWNTMIRGYAESDNPRPAIDLYAQMVLDSVEPDTHTFPFLLKAVAKLLDVRAGEKLHCAVTRNGFEPLVFVQNALVHMYAACGRAESAHNLFDLMSVRNLVTWNSVINGYALNGKPDEVLMLYKEMANEGVEPDGFTVVSLLSASAELGALTLGKRLHVYMIKAGLDKNLQAGNALLDLYAKCGRIKEAHLFFGEIRERSVVSWTTLIVGLAVNGLGLKAIGLFKEMEMMNLVPTDITFVGVLYACSHCGLVDEGFHYFYKMNDRYKIDPKIEHYGCMVDLLGRAGKVQEAYKFILNMPFKPNAVIWRTLLGASSIHGHLDLAETARMQLLQLEPKHCGDFVLLSNLYASGRRWTEVQSIRSNMFENGVRKIPGYSLVELRNSVVEFTVGDRSHPQDKEIYRMLEEMTRLLKKEGYVPCTENVLADIQEEEKETALAYHSEKIAIAFMLINTAPRTPITVMKNLRVCGDCHLAIKLISKIFEREIVVRDRSRFHHFKDGACSCKDYWISIMGKIDIKKALLVELYKMAVGAAASDHSGIALNLHFPNCQVT
ncbi:LOW QUALITY PROTEIN: hypothetical protein V2J09_022060 [Rumex salicifolius]